MGVMTVSSQNFMEIDMPGWWLSGSSFDLDFRNNRYYDSSNVVSGLSNLLSISRASIGYAKTSGGTLTQFSSGQFRQTDLGLLIEGARTNVVLWNGDLTNAAWVKTNITAVQDQVGADGVVNGATSLLATAGNGTALQSITLASSAQFQSAWVKRLTGTGAVNMTMDNGATWTAIPVTDTVNWTQVTIPGQTLANPTVGFQIVTNGDKIAVDFVQNEAGTFASSPIPTTTASATRAADAVIFIGTAETLLENAVKSAVIDCNSGVAATVNQTLIEGGGGLYDHWYVNSDTIIHTVYPAQLDIQTPVGSGAFSTTGVKSGWARDGSSMSIVANNGTVVSGSHAISVGTASYRLGAETNGANAWFGYFRRLTLWNSKLADATLQAFTV